MSRRIMMSGVSGAFVVIAEFRVQPGKRDEFLVACREDSLRSTTDEAGCRHFNVLTDPENESTVVLHEVYDDRAAFDTHLATPHWAAFDNAVKKFDVATVGVRFFDHHAG
ncbi:putative quinol monooxygenase [Rhizosaccharibacter radicis]|uniref:Antibiotic biosynthesis monooxygenase n=1 Tax=Rhizosaccharibacter radicis TaxID=2782605 RepID=A0ABT1VYS1_9PROT|nr:antibiotic biosynthesis monooxygenase [Acetobacteraceae bacterium KSS12]